MRWALAAESDRSDSRGGRPYANLATFDSVLPLQ